MWNLWIASQDHIAGNERVAGEAVRLWEGCNLFGEHIGMEFKPDGRKYEFRITRPNKALAATTSSYSRKTGFVANGAGAIGMTLCGHIRWATQNKDGSFFRDLARLCEAPSREEIGLRAIGLHHWLSLLHLDGRPHFTARQLCDMALKQGVVAADGIPERQQMHEICRQLGIKLLRGKGWKKLRRNSN
jgi:hypothetical protein